MKRKILVGNWKMNKTIAETIDFVNKVNDRTLKVANEELIVGIAPSYICLPALDSSWKRGPEVCGSSCLTCFTEHVFRVHPRCRLGQSVIRFRGWIAFHAALHLIDLPSADGHLARFLRFDCYE